VLILKLNTLCIQSESLACSCRTQKKDVEFIRRLEKDLRACQCEPWIDEIEIRHGKPWLDEIFSSGIPSCEVLLCYITENSINSSMVKQEIDARLLERLQNDRVTLLLYVNTEESRSKLRLDLQRLQAPQLNDDNYSVMLPRVVSEIWRSYAEHSAAAAAQSEKVKRLEAEIRVKDLESNAAQNIFSASEGTEFSTIWTRLDREAELRITVVKKASRSVGGMPVIGEETVPTDENSTHAEFHLRIGSLFRSAVATEKFQPSKYAVRAAIERDALLLMQLKESEFEITFDIPVDFEVELLRYGLVERQPVPSESSDSRFALTSMFRETFRVVFTAKFDRFLFWIDHNFGQWDPLKPVVRTRQ
jgi:TIR domain